jgi:hypothetical protein
MNKITKTVVRITTWGIINTFLFIALDIFGSQHLPTTKSLGQAMLFGFSFAICFDFFFFKKEAGGSNQKSPVTFD